MSLDQGNRRPMNTIVELSPEQAQISPEEIDFSRDSGGVSLSPLAQGTLTNVFSTIVAMSKKSKMNSVNFHPESETKDAEKSR